MNSLLTSEALSRESNAVIPKVPFITFASSTMRNRYQIEIVESPQQYRNFLKLRKLIYVDGEKFPFKAMYNGFERKSVHIMAKKKNGRYVGAVSVKLNDIDGLPLQKYINLNQYSNKKLAEIGKLGVLEDTDDSSVFYQLVGAAYALIRFCGYNTIVMHTLKRMTRNIQMYKKMGFKEIQDFHLFGQEEGIGMILDLDQVSGTMWKPTQLTKLAKRLVMSLNPETINGSQ